MSRNEEYNRVSSGGSQTQGLTDVEGARAVARLLFEGFDKDKDGNLNGGEIASVITETYKNFNRKFTPSKVDIESYGKVLDKNKDGRISYQDIEEICVKYLSLFRIKLYIFQIFDFIHFFSLIQSSLLFSPSSPSCSFFLSSSSSYYPMNYLLNFLVFYYYFKVFMQRHVANDPIKEGSGEEIRPEKKVHRFRHAKIGSCKKIIQEIRSRQRWNPHHWRSGSFID